MQRRHVTIAAVVVSVALIVASAVPAFAVEADIIGTVYSSAEEPLEGVLVQAFDAKAAWLGSPGAPLAEATTDADGSYLIHVPDRYCVFAYSDLTSTYRDLTTFGRGFPLEQAVGALPLETTVTVDMYLPELDTLVAERIVRLGGLDRYQTAVAISAYSFESADTVVIASGANFPDALAAAPLAGINAAPILLTRPDALPAEVIAEIQALGALNAIIVGGEGAVSKGVENTLMGMNLSVERIAGADRYATSAMIVHEVVQAYIDAGVEVPTPFVCRGDAFPDALSASPFAYSQARPILLTQPQSLPPASQNAWHEITLHDVPGMATVLVVGGEGAIGIPVLMDLVEAADGHEVLYGRIAGADRYGTSVEMIRVWERSFDFIGLATGTTYPDALTGGAALGRSLGGLLLTPGTALHAQVASELSVHGPFVMELEAYGGTGAISDGVLASVEGALGTSIYDIDAAGHRVNVTAASVYGTGVESAGAQPVGVEPIGVQALGSRATGVKRAPALTQGPAEKPSVEMELVRAR